jgi:hypothetical protein
MHTPLQGMQKLQPANLLQPELQASAALESSSEHAPLASKASAAKIACLNRIGRTSESTRNTLPSPRATRLGPSTVISLCLAFFSVGCKKGDSAPAVRGAASADAAHHAAARSLLQVKPLSAGGHRLLTFTAPRLELRLIRPDRDDPRVLLGVPGTYTSPEGLVEGVVVHQHRVVQRDRRAWEGVLLIRSGRPEVLRATADLLDEKPLARLAASGASLIQGHLLVGDGEVRPLKASPALRRRAIITRPDGSFMIVESLEPLPLADFASDLRTLGAAQAMNLDMGTWSEGFYREPDTGQVRPLGDDFRATDRQTNWLVLLGDG